MSKKYLAAILLLMLLPVMAVPVNATVQRVCPPRFDQITGVVEADPDEQMLMFQAGEIDFIPDVIRADHIDKARTEGHEVKSMPGFHVCYIGINQRDYVPYDAGQPDANRSLAPLNYTGFRQALYWSSLSMDQKESEIATIYGPDVVTAAFTVVPEALGAWNNPDVNPGGGDFVKANATLHAAGFYIEGNILYQPNDEPVRSSIVCMSPSTAPTSVAFAQSFVDNWQAFFQTYLGVTNCVIINKATPPSTEVLSAFMYRNFDMYMLCWGLSRFPDYLYDFFHSSQDMPWGYNSPGVKDPLLDYYLETVKWGLVYEEKLEACHQAQVMLVEELVTYICMYHRIYWCIVRQNWPSGQGPGFQQKLMNIVNVKGVGADSGWTWMLMHWNTTDGSTPSLQGGNVNYAWSVEEIEVNLHPGWAQWAYEWWWLGEILDSLTAVSPNLVDMAWIACDWKVETFDWEPLKIYNGTKVTFRIRDGVYWHDGWPVTVEDIKFAWEFVRNFPRYASIYQYLMWVEIHDPNTITAYFDITSQYIIYDLASVALYWPKHIYNPDWHPNPLIDTVTADPSTYTYDEWMADYTGPTPDKYTPPREMGPSCSPPTALVGCGPYYHYDYDPEALVGILKKNPYYWPCGPVCCNIDISGRIDPDTDLPASTWICNQGAKAVSEVQHEPSEVNISRYEVYVDDPEQITPEYIGDVGAPIASFTCEEYPIPGYVFNLPPGLHTVCIKVYETGVPDDPIAECCKLIVVSIREDLNYDCKVRIDDVRRAAKAFGSAPPPFPGYERWDERADVNDDFKVRIDDIRAIAKLFGWPK